MPTNQDQLIHQLQTQLTESLNLAEHWKKVAEDWESQAKQLQHQLNLYSNTDLDKAMRAYFRMKRRYEKERRYNIINLANYKSKSDNANYSL